MLKYLTGKVSDRKLRLFACACSRQVWDEMTDAGSRTALTLSERFADEEASAEELTEAHSVAAGIVRPLERHWGPATRQAGAARTAEAAARPHALTARGTRAKRARPGMQVAEEASNAAKWTRLWTQRRTSDPERLAEQFAVIAADQAALLRDLIGNPFRPVFIPPAYLGKEVLALAQAAYEERTLPSGELELERLAVLSDAVEEAGCDDASLLDHLRSPGPHVRGCWVVDLILGLT